MHMDASRAPDEPADDGDYSLGPLLRLASRRATTAFTAALEPLGIEGRHFGVLMHLARAGALNQRRLGALTGSDKSTMVRTLDDLEGRGLVVRRAAVGDRRAYAVELTGTGREVFEKAEQVAFRVNDELLACLPAAERDELRRLLRAFVGAGGSAGGRTAP
jgi:MarR family transcriptional regulator, lower aerobic nicotinate degradation pathway regulator